MTDNAQPQHPDSLAPFLRAVAAEIAQLPENERAAASLAFRTHLSVIADRATFSPVANAFADTVSISDNTPTERLSAYIAFTYGFAQGYAHAAAAFARRAPWPPPN